MITLSTELSRIRGIGANFLTRLKRLNITTVEHLLWHFPFRYDDFSSVVPIAELELNQTVTLSGVVKKVNMRQTWRRRMTIVEVYIADHTGTIKAIWFNQPYISKTLLPGRRVNLSGKVSIDGDEMYLSNPSYEVVREMGEITHTAALIPVYPETKGLTSRGLRYLIKPLLKIIGKLPDFIPESVLKSENIPGLTDALTQVHFPLSLEEVERAKSRFAFENLFLLQLNNLRIRRVLSRSKAPKIGCVEESMKEITTHLPFTLTDSQQTSVQEILDDLARPHPMNRLLQGDVGSGKTIVAAIAALVVARDGKQATFMAPTEVLARQHYQTLTGVFGTLIEESHIGVGLLTGGETRIFFAKDLEEISTGKKLRSHLVNEIDESRVHIIIGTHALINNTHSARSKSVHFPHLGLVVVDEQHRFGVEQRATLTKNKSLVPHFISMSATPIPRTLSLTLFGDLDLSTIYELPKGRKPIVTKLVAPENRPKAHEFIRSQVKGGRQVFVICPRIEVAVTDDEIPFATPRAFAVRKMQEVRAVTEEYTKLSEKVFPSLRIEMLHGRLKSVEKADIMQRFKAGEIDILVSTSVIEVGVDVPNATVMIIEGVDRFGLAQLYQFRGRIGRGEHQSYCFLFTDSKSESVTKRLHALLEAKNGFELAEHDLALRGPGEFLGDKQTGLPDLAMRSLNNLPLIKRSRDAAKQILTKDPTLAKHPHLKERLRVFHTHVHLE